MEKHIIIEAREKAVIGTIHKYYLSPFKHNTVLFSGPLRS